MIVVPLSHERSETLSEAKQYHRRYRAMGRAGGKEHDRKVNDLMLAHLPITKVKGAYNRAA